MRLSHPGIRDSNEIKPSSVGDSNEITERDKVQGSGLWAPQGRRVTSLSVSCSLLCPQGPLGPPDH